MLERIKMRKQQDKEVNILMLVIMASVFAYVVCALQHITRNSGVTLLVGVMSVCMMSNVLIGLWIGEIRTKASWRLNVSGSRGISDRKGCNIWIHLVEKFMSCVAVVLGTLMIGLATMVMFISDKGQEHVGLRMLLSSVPVIVATIRLCKRTQKWNTLRNILFNHACGQNSQCFDLF